MKKLTYFMGKKIFSKSGEYSGKIKDVLITKGMFTGVLVKGKTKFFIDKEFFTADNGDAILISIDPVINALGKQVYDRDGRRIGKVIGIDRKTNANDYSFLIVKKHFFAQPFSVPKAHVEVLKKNILLNKSYEK